MIGLGFKCDATEIALNASVNLPSGHRVAETTRTGDPKAENLTL
jgi:hypothetical protein